MEWVDNDPLVENHWRAKRRKEREKKNNVAEQTIVENRDVTYALCVTVWPRECSRLGRSKIFSSVHQKFAGRATEVSLKIAGRDLVYMTRREIPVSLRPFNWKTCRILGRPRWYDFLSPSSFELSLLFLFQRLPAHLYFKDHVISPFENYNSKEIFFSFFTLVKVEHRILKFS